MLPRWHAGRCCGDRLTGEATLLIADSDRPIEALVDFHGGFGVTAPARSLGDLQAMRAERDGVVVADDALVLEAEDGVGIERRGPGPVRRRGLHGPLCEASIEAREELRQKGIGPCPIAHAGETQLATQAILEGPKEPLDAAFGLRAAGGNPADAQFVQGAPDLSPRGCPGQLLGEGEWLLRRALKDAVAIAVHGDGNPLRLGEGVEDQEVAVRIFLVPKRGGGDFPGRVVDGREERETRATLVEPGVITPVDLHQQAWLRHALPAPPVAGRAARTGATDSRGAEEAGEGLAREPQRLAFGEELTEVLEVDVGVGGLGEPHDLRPGGVIKAPRRATSAVPMDQGLWAASTVRASQAPDLTGREAQEVSGFGQAQLAAIQGVQDGQLLLCAVRQGNHPPRIRLGGGRTFSLSD